MTGTHELVIAILSALCGGICGGSLGILVMALCVAASRKPLMTEENGEESISRLDEPGG